MLLCCQMRALPNLSYLPMYLLRVDDRLRGCGFVVSLLCMCTRTTPEGLSLSHGSGGKKAIDKKVRPANTFI